MANISPIQTLRSPGTQEILRSTVQKPKTAIIPVSYRFRSYQSSDYQPNLYGPAPLEEKDFGEFYELLAQALYGGERKTYHKAYFSGRGYVAEHKPDLVSKDFVYDQKGLGPSTTMLIRDRQLALYHQMQLLQPNKRFAYQIFRHEVKGATKKEKFGNMNPKSYLSGELARNTLYCLNLPLSIITALWMANLKGEINNRFDYFCHDDKTREMDSSRRRKRLHEDHFTGVKATTLRALFDSPKPMIRAIGLNPDWYAVSKRVSPENFFVNGRLIKQFPIVNLREKYPQAWLHYLSSEIKPRVVMDEEMVSDSVENPFAEIEAAAACYEQFARRNKIKENGYKTKLASYPDVFGLEDFVMAEEASPAKDHIPF